MKSTEFIKTVFQNKPAECGAACLCMILNYYGMNITLEEICFKHPVSDNGCSAGDILHMASDYGFQCRGFKNDPTQADRISTPAIIHWKNNHFIVLESFDGNYFYVNDPAIGRIRINPAAMVQNYSGVYLVFNPNFKN